MLAKQVLNTKRLECFVFVYYFDEKNFDENQKVKWRNDKGLCRNLNEVSVVMHSKFSVTTMIFFGGGRQQRGRFHATLLFFTGYKNQCHSLNWCVGESCKGGDRQSTSQKTIRFPIRLFFETTQTWMHSNLLDGVFQDTWTPNSSELNPLNYYV